MVLVWVTLLISFGYYSFGILLDHGYLAFFPPIPQPVSLQVFLDLCISGAIAIFLMYDRRKKHHKLITPVIVAAVAFPFLGSQALLAYMIYDWFNQKKDLHT
ncbi:MAG: hypothetical protein CME61_03915 [Halobacteriovoraceae bacterium]|nr:hypothetical protein [Halobacteriovoraceae bacterium]